VNLPRSALIDPESGWFKPLEQQQQLLEQAGVVLPAVDRLQGQQHQAAGKDDSQGSSDCQKVVIYCNGGVAACTAALALQRLGHSNWCVYDGSWNEYSSTDLPAAVPSL
jgi:3-mercaptopyruvate sulfurtransferase SseA